MPLNPYPEDYEAQVAQAEDERQRSYEPTLQATVPDLPSYETVFLGFPIWGMTAPSVLRSFLSKHDLSGKTLVPFITHGGYGLLRCRLLLPQTPLCVGPCLRAPLVDLAYVEAGPERIPDLHPGLGDRAQRRHQ